MARSIAKECLRFTGLFEAELLTELILRQWRHPHAASAEYRSNLLEAAAEILRASIRGERLFDDLDPLHVNFVAALWYAEHVAMEVEASAASPVERRARKQWLKQLLKAVPSCFCNPENLG